jgi:steroid 5-alpha reductase family enzyme
MENLTFSLLVLAGSVVVCFFAGLFTRNYSHVDRLWSLLPAIYVLIWLTEFKTNTAFLIPAILVIAWGIRLTWNFGRRGGYQFSLKKGFCGEDYRWAVLREKIPNRFLYELFNLFFICIFQLGLIFAFTLPLYFLGKANHTPTVTDFLLYALHGFLLMYETVADNQQYAYHSKKDKPPYNENPRYRLGFNTFGLWKYSRHPNYMAEVAQWVVVWLYLVSATGTLHWSGFGALTLIALFAGSTVFTEQITLSKYPEYARWKKAVPAFVPFLTLRSRLNNKKAFSRELNINWDDDKSWKSNFRSLQ